MQKEIKEINITIPKQDYVTIILSIKENGSLAQLDNSDLLFMTVSSFPSSTEYKFQKSLEEGIEYDTETGKYIITINSEDTKNLQYNIDYGYDITIYYGGDKPSQKVVGKFKISDKFTVNEVV